MLILLLGTSLLFSVDVGDTSVDAGQEDTSESVDAGVDDTSTTSADVVALSFGLDGVAILVTVVSAGELSSGLDVVTAMLEVGLVGIGERGVVVNSLETKKIKGANLV